jgi:HlyD family secretion protein
VSRDSEALSVVREFHSETDAIRGMPEPRWARTTLFVLGGSLLAIVLLMFVTRVDRVVSGEGGKIVSADRPSVYQALDPSIIKSIDVREGDEVKPAQLLATLDPTFAAADVKQVSQQIASLETQIARQEALLSGQPLTFAKKDDPDFVRYAALQKAYYDQQLAQYAAQVASFDARIQETKATVAKYRSEASRYVERENIAREIEKIRTTLAESGSGSRLNMLVSQDQRFELLRSLEFSNNSLAESEQTLVSLTADRDAFVRQWSSQLSQELVVARNNLDVARADLEKATKRKDLVRLTASEPAVVLTVAKLSVGSVLKQGDTLFTLMPIGSAVEAEVYISARDIGFVRKGDACTMKIGAFNYMEHGVANGAVLWTSDNAFTTDDDGKPVPAYYKARCSVDAAQFRNMPEKFRLIPGMTVQAELKVGTRSVAMYVLGGLLSGFGESMREP